MRSNRASDARGVPLDGGSLLAADGAQVDYGAHLFLATPPTSPHAVGHAVWEQAFARDSPLWPWLAEVVSWRFLIVATKPK